MPRTLLYELAYKYEKVIAGLKNEIGEAKKQRRKSTPAAPAPAPADDSAQIRHGAERRSGT